MDSIIKSPVRRSDAYNNIVKMFCVSQGDENTDKVFATIKDFMVFAASVGFELGLSKPLSSDIKTTSITLETYQSSDHDAYIYLMALSKEQSLDLLKDEGIRRAITIFEEYCNAGLEHIDKWVFDNSAIHPPQDLLFNQLLDYLIERDK